MVFMCEVISIMELKMKYGYLEIRKCVCDDSFQVNKYVPVNKKNKIRKAMIKGYMKLLSNQK